MNKIVSCDVTLDVNKQFSRQSDWTLLTSTPFRCLYTHCVNYLFAGKYDRLDGFSSSDREENEIHFLNTVFMPHNACHDLVYGE